MRKLIITSLFFILASFVANAQIYKGKTDSSYISFFSKATVEDVAATNKKVSVVLNTSTNDIQFGVPMISFKFRKALMEEHFNEKYVESPKYPTCVFKGKINEKIDYKKDGEHKVSAKGTLNLHGVTKEIEANGILTVKGDEVHIISVFKIKIADYNIKVPSLFTQNIAEIVDVTVKVTLEPSQKN